MHVLANFEPKDILIFGVIAFGLFLLIKGMNTPSPGEKKGNGSNKSGSSNSGTSNTTTTTTTTTTNNTNNGN